MILEIYRTSVGFASLSLFYVCFACSPTIEIRSRILSLGLARRERRR